MKFYIPALYFVWMDQFFYCVDLRIEEVDVVISLTVKNNNSF